MIFRDLEKRIIDHFNKGKIIILLGPRQVGKTTLIKKIISESKTRALFLNGDEPDVRDILTNTTSTQLKAIIGENKLVAIDEAQRIQNIGITLKLIIDNIPDVQVLVSGSSSLELANEIIEPLTGRKYEYFMYPISFQEMSDHTNLLEETRMMEHRMIFGYYPDVITTEGDEKEILGQLAISYLYK